MSNSKSVFRKAALSVVAALGLAGVACAQTTDWAAVVEAARAEGEVAIYSAQSQDLLNELGRKFEAEYGVKVIVVRAVETDLWPKVDVEVSSGKGIADIMVGAGVTLLKERGEKGYFVVPQGPAFSDPAFNRDRFLNPTGYYQTGATVLTFNWNTDLLPEGLTDYKDILRPDLKGMIGIPQAKTLGQVDFYRYLTDRYGEEFLVELAALEPQLYAGALPQAQAVVAGEIAVALHALPLESEKAKGAPVDWGLADTPWGTPFFGGILTSAPHPNAAQLLADFMITREGQATLGKLAASVMPGVEGTLMSGDRLRQQDPEVYTADFVKGYVEKWNALFLPK